MTIQLQTMQQLRNFTFDDIPERTVVLYVWKTQNDSMQGVWESIVREFTALNNKHLVFATVSLTVMQSVDANARRQCIRIYHMGVCKELYGALLNQTTIHSTIQRYVNMQDMMKVSNKPKQSIIIDDDEW
jgi:hypothetical protein